MGACLVMLIKLRMEGKWKISSSYWFGARHQGPELIYLPEGSGAGRKISICNINMENIPTEYRAKTAVGVKKFKRDWRR